MTREDNLYNYNIMTKNFAKDVLKWYSKYENGSDTVPNINKMKNRLKETANKVLETSVAGADADKSFDNELKKEQLLDAFKSIPFDNIERNVNAGVYWRSVFKVPSMQDLKDFHTKLQEGG